MRKWLNWRLMLTGGAAVASAAAFAVGAGSTPALADTTGCPSTSGKQVSNLVGASYSGSTTVNYIFNSFGNQSPTGGVPGLIRYCVYPAAAPDDGSITIAAQGDNGDAWKDAPPDPQFSFDRTDGNPSNIGLDNRRDYLMGTATWAAGAPGNQPILLHINDPVECTSLYGAGGDPAADTVGTCWVFPGSQQAPPAADLTASKDANPSFTHTFDWSIKKDVDSHRQNISLGGPAATFNYTVTVTKGAGSDGGWQVSGTIQVVNPNAVAVSGVLVTDAINDPNANCSVTDGVNATIPGGPGSAGFAYTCSYSAPPASSSKTNTATVAWPTETLSDGSNLTGNFTTGTAGIDWSNITPTPVDNCTNVSDSNLGTTVAGPICDTTTFTYSESHAGTGGTCTDYSNTVSFTTVDLQKTGSAKQTVTVCVGKDLTVSKSATPTFTRTFAWGVQKSVDQTRLNIASGGSATFTYTVSVTHDSGTDSAWQVGGAITVNNPNNWEAIVATITDAVGNGGLCAVTDVNGGLNETIPAGGSLVVPYTCTWASAPSSSSGTNTATVTWDKSAYSTPTGTASGDLAFAFATPTTIVDGSVTVTDTLKGLLGTVSYTVSSPKTFSYSLSFSGVAGTCKDFTNVVTIVTSDTSTSATDTKTVTVCVGLDLTVSKTAVTTFTRTYNWTITKNVDKTLLDAGGTATYTVTVTETPLAPFTDSGWLVSGLITVNNPNDWEPITANLSDAVDNGGSCSVTGGSGASVPASSSITRPYLCTYASAPSPSSGTNSATASWNGAAAFTPDGSATGTAGFAFVTPTNVFYKTIMVTDTIQGTTTTLGSLTATDSTPFTTHAYTYTRHFNPPSSSCVTINNTATIVQTGQTAGASVRVCNTGALTMGYWQNKNGQAIINGTNQASLGIWLRQFHAFSNAPSSGLGVYVSSIIGSAVCTSSTNTCNSMLRAQMLATALDVYFSDNALGGNRINAPAPIGGVTIDLTRIWGSENVSAAFGGATSMTVMNMLLYQNTTDPLADNGAAWYGQNKPLQVLAKDAFDSINNQTAVSP